MDPKTYRIRLETAHEVLATFGITSPTRKYERWVKDDGFDLKDFDEVLFESPFVYVIDWRAWLQEELETIATSLAKHGVELQTELDPDGEAGHVSCGDRRVPVAYRPDNESRLDELIEQLALVVSPHIEFRASARNGGGDTAVYAALPADSWAALEAAAGDVVKYFFVPLTL